MDVGTACINQCVSSRSCRVYKVHEGVGRGGGGVGVVINTTNFRKLSSFRKFYFSILILFLQFLHVKGNWDKVH